MIKQIDVVCDWKQLSQTIPNVAIRFSVLTPAIRRGPRAAVVERKSCLFRAAKQMSLFSPKYQITISNKHTIIDPMWSKEAFISWYVRFAAVNLDIYFSMFVSSSANFAA